MTTTQEKVAKFIAENEEKTYIEFMTIAGLGKEYKAAKSIPQIKDVLGEFVDRGYSIIETSTSGIDDSMVWRVTLALNGIDITYQDIEVRFIK